MKKSIFCLLSVLLLSSCGFDFNGLNSSSERTSFTSHKNDKNAIIEKSLPFTNLSTDYSIASKSITTYYINKDDVPYVEVLDFVQSLNGFINYDGSIRHLYDIENNMLVLSYYQNDTLRNYVQFQWDTNNIFVSDFDFFSYIVKSSKKTNYGAFLKYTKYESWQKKSVTFSLGSYYFDILFQEDKCLIPFTIANMLFCSQNLFNVYYTEAGYYGYYGEMSNGSDAYNTIYNTNTNGKRQSASMRQASINSLFFAMDYFYGLKTTKGINQFKNYVSNQDLSLLWSTNAEDNHEGLKHIIYNQLDELHSRLDGRNIYSSKHEEKLASLDESGTFRKKFYDLYYKQKDFRKEILGESIPEVRYCGDTAIITLDSFKTGANSNIYDSEGKIKDNAWEYDTYFYMRHCMEDIIKHSEINDIVLDLSLNGGGNIAALRKTLGFLTDEVILDYDYNTLTNEYTCTQFKVDTDGDGNYDNDAYDQYRWTILSSMNTFSAANDFINKVKQQNLAKVIGNTSGGGMCSVLPIVLADGTPLAISSYDSSRFVINENGTNHYMETEYGFEPHMIIPYEDYYNDEKLVQYVDSVYLEQ